MATSKALTARNIKKRRKDYGLVRMEFWPHKDDLGGDTVEAMATLSQRRIQEEREHNEEKS